MVRMSRSFDILLMQIDSGLLRTCLPRSLDGPQIAIPGQCGEVCIARVGGGSTVITFAVEYVAILHHPDGRQETQRFDKRDAFREWLVSLEQHLEADRWTR